jgi:hypothetical protein
VPITALDAHVSEVLAEVDGTGRAGDTGEHHHHDDAARAALFAELDELWPPAGMLEDTEPGPGLAALLNTVSFGSLADGELVAYVAASQRLASWAASRELAAVEALTRRVASWRGVGHGADQVTPEEAAATEIGAALTLSPQSARIRVELAKSLTRLPMTRFALAGGRIDLVRARAIVDGVAGLTDEVAAAVEARVMTRAPGQTAGQLRALPAPGRPVDRPRRRRGATQDEGDRQRRVPRGAGGRDGAPGVDRPGPVEQIEATWTWLTSAAAVARAADIRAGGPVRTLAQCRSDVLAELGEHALAVADLPRRHGRRPQIGVVVSRTTLLGLDDEPGELVGVGPITAQVARRIAGDGTWRRLLSEPRTGRLAEPSAGTYEPPQELRDFVIARDRTCRGLGCRMPADRCDLDHRVPWPQGRTDEDNLDPACRGWHRAKTLTDVTVEPDGQGGLWITLPSGRCYHRPAEPILDHAGLFEQPPPAVDPPDDPDPPAPFASLDVPPF